MNECGHKNTDMLKFDIVKCQFRQSEYGLHQQYRKVELMNDFDSGLVEKHQRKRRKK